MDDRIITNSKLEEDQDIAENSIRPLIIPNNNTNLNPFLSKHFSL